MIRLRALLAAAALAAAAACAAASGAASASGVGNASPGPASPRYLYVTNQGAASVSVIDVDARSEVARVDLQALGFGPTAKPHDVAVEPDGSYWYVTLIGENRVLKFDRENRLVGQVEMEVPGLVIVHPTEDLLFVGRSMSAVNPPSSVAMIRRSDMTLLDEIEVVFPRPHALQARPQGDRVYTASLAENRFAAIDPESGDVELFEAPPPAGADAAHVMAGDSAHAGADSSMQGMHGPARRDVHTLVEFAISPDGGTMVTGGEISGEILVYDITAPDSPRLLRTLAVGGAPWHPAFAPDGRTLWVPLHQANQVAVIDTATWEVADRIMGRGLAQPHAVSLTPDGATAFVSNNNTGGEYTPTGDDPHAGTVVAIDARTHAIVSVIEVGANATGMDLAHPGS